MITHEQRVEWGRRGGLVTASKYGPSHMSQIGSKGFESYANKYCGGNKAIARQVLGLDGITRAYASTPAWWSIWLDEYLAKKEG